MIIGIPGGGCMRVENIPIAFVVYKLILSVVDSLIADPAGSSAILSLEAITCFYHCNDNAFVCYPASFNKVTVFIVVVLIIF